MDCLTSKDITASLHFRKSDDNGGKETFSCVKMLHKPTLINGVQRDCLPAEFFVIGQVVEEEVQFLQGMQQGGKTITRASFWLEERRDPTSQVQWERTLLTLRHIVGCTNMDVDTSFLFSVNPKTGAMRLRVHASESHTGRVSVPPSHQHWKVLISKLRNCLVTPCTMATVTCSDLRASLHCRLGSPYGDTLRPR